MKVYENPDFHAQPDFDLAQVRQEIMGLSSYIVATVNDRPGMPFGHLEVSPLEAARGARVTHRTTEGLNQTILEIEEHGPSAYDIHVASLRHEDMAGLSKLTRTHATMRGEEAKVRSSIQFYSDTAETDEIRSLPPKLPIVKGMLADISQSVGVQPRPQARQAVRDWLQRKISGGRTA